MLRGKTASGTDTAPAGLSWAPWGPLPCAPEPGPLCAGAGGPVTGLEEGSGWLPLSGDSSIALVPGELGVPPASVVLPGRGPWPFRRARAPVSLLTPLLARHAAAARGDASGRYGAACSALHGCACMSAALARRWDLLVSVPRPVCPGAGPCPHPALPCWGRGRLRAAGTRSRGAELQGGLMRAEQRAGKWGRVQQGQGQGPAPGEEQPQAPGQAGADLLESSSAERDWECWGTTG